MSKQYDIVIDNMSNLNPKHIKEYEEIVSLYNDSFDTPNKYKIEFKLIDTPLEECIARDSERENPIGESVIKKQWRQYRNYIITKSIKNMLSNNPPKIVAPHAIIVDMDATLCFNTERPFYGEGSAERMIDDVPNEAVVNIVKNYSGEILIVTGRDESAREVTKTWLISNGINPSKLYMREVGDFTTGVELKKNIYENHIKDNYNIDFVLEDSTKVVKMYRELGLTVLQPNEGKF